MPNVPELFTKTPFEEKREQEQPEKGYVLRYGADPTGKVDSTAAFKAAAAVSNVVRVPAGTYLIEGTVDVSGKSVLGDGVNATILTKNGTSSAMLTVKSVLPTTISGFTFTNSNHSATEGSYIKVELPQTGLPFVPILIEDIETQWGFHGIELVGGGAGNANLFVTINRIWHYKIKGNAFWFRKGPDAATVRDFYVQEGTSTSVGIRLEGWNPAHIFEGGEILGGGYGLYATIEGGVAGFEHRPEDCRFTDCFFDTIQGKFEVKNVGTTTAGSALVKMTVAGSGVNTGNVVTGEGVPGGTTVSEVKLATNEIKLSANIEAGKGGTPTLTFTNGTKNSIVRCVQCSDMRFVNCWVASPEASFKVQGFEFESCELMACVQCIANQCYYGGYFISGCTSTSITGCVATAGAANTTYQGLTVAHYMIVGASKNTILVGGNSKGAANYAALIGPTCNRTEINGLGLESVGKVPPILNEIEASKAAEVYVREGGKEGSLNATEITSWFSAKVEEFTTPRAKIHAGNIEFRGILKVAAAQEVKELETFMTAQLGYRPLATARRTRFAYGVEGKAPTGDLWVEIQTNGEIASLAGSPPVKAGEVIYIENGWFPIGKVGEG